MVHIQSPTVRLLQLSFLVSSVFGVIQKYSFQGDFGSLQNVGWPRGSLVARGFDIEKYTKNAAIEQNRRNAMIGFSRSPWSSSIGRGADIRFTENNLRGIPSLGFGRGEVIEETQNGGFGIPPPPVLSAQLVLPIGLPNSFHHPFFRQTKAIKAITREDSPSDSDFARTTIMTRPTISFEKRSELPTRIDDVIKF